MKNLTLEIEGMKCGGCVSTVREALAAVDGVQETDVDLAEGRARIVGDDGLEEAALVRAVEGAGYAVGAVVVG